MRHFCCCCCGCDGWALEAPDRDLRGLRHDDDEALEPGELMDVREDDGPTDEPDA